MSLLKLLSAGKSLVGVKDAASPYRMRSGSRLPKFNSAKNPFARAAKTEPPKTGSPSAEPRAETGSLFENEPASPFAPFRKPPAEKPVKAAAPPEPKKPEPKPASAAPAAKEKKPGAISGLVKKFNPLAYLPKRQPGSRAAARPRAARTIVQGELSLEKVRVLRNELNDSDLDFVAAKPAVAGTSGVAGARLPVIPQPRLTTWGRLTSRVFNAVETQAQ